MKAKDLADRLLMWAERIGRQHSLRDRLLEEDLKEAAFMVELASDLGMEFVEPGEVIEPEDENESDEADDEI